MKFLILLTLFVSSFSAMSAEVLSAKLDTNRENILVEVQYSGGFAEHNFALKVGESCLESFPVQCSAELIETIQGTDTCEAVIRETAVFNLESLRLTDSYFEGASLAITGSLSRVSVTLP